MVDYPIIVGILGWAALLLIMYAIFKFLFSRMMVKELWILVKMLFGTRPSDFVYKKQEVVTMKHFPFKGYKAMAWCGKIVHREGASEVDARTMNHEKIHVAQAMVCNDSWVRYYLSYLWEWLRRGFLAPMTANYYVSKFESEAYANEDRPNYLKYYMPFGINKYSIKGAKKLYKKLGGTPEAWKKYVKTL